MPIDTQTLLIIGGVGIFIAIILIALLKKRKPEHKRIDLSKVVKKDFDGLYNVFYEKVNKRMMQGFNKVGYCIGMFEMLWDSTTDLQTQIKAMAKGKKRNYLKNMLEEERKDNKNIKKLLVIRYTGRKATQILLGKLNIKYSYMLVPEEYVKYHSKELEIKGAVSKDEYLGIIYFSKSGRDIIENIAYKVSRSEELTELADYVPKQNYLEKTTAESVAKAREKANIEKEKYKGQVEAME